MESVKEVHEELTCEHGEPTTKVCGACGRPVCSRGSIELSDPGLPRYNPGWKTLGLVVTLVIGVPLVFNRLFPDLIGTVVLAIFDQALYLRIGFVRGSILLGLAMILLLRLRTSESFQLLVRRANERVMCNECKGRFQRRRVLQAGIGIVGVTVALFGFYLMYDYGRLRDLWYVGLGAGIVLVRIELTQLFDRLLA